MKTLLILTFLFNGESSQAPVGVMLDESTCIVAGVGMQAVLEQTNPGLQVEWHCEPVGGASA